MHPLEYLEKMRPFEPTYSDIPPQQEEPYLNFDKWIADGMSFKLKEKEGHLNHPSIHLSEKV
jgi:hypothetical protein